MSDLDLEVCVHGGLPKSATQVARSIMHRPTLLFKRAVSLQASRKLASSSELPALKVALARCASMMHVQYKEDAVLHAALAKLGVDVRQPQWDDPLHDWAQVLVAIRNTLPVVRC